MKVLHVIGPTEYGGAQTQLLGLLRAARHGVWEPTLCSIQPGPLLPEFEALGIPVMDLRRRASPGMLRLGAIRHRLSTEPFDVVHAMLWHANAFARLAVAGRRRRPAVVVSERSVEPRSRGRTALDRVLGRWTDLYVGNSDAVAEFIRRVHPVGDDGVVMIPNAVDRRVFHPAGDRPRSGRRVGSIGRLEPEKGFDVLVDAARLLERRVPGAEVVVAGTGSRRAQLDAVVAASGAPVRFVGAVRPGEGVAAFLRGLDVLVLPSLFREGRPNVLLEALACGVPVVATDIPGVAETIGTGGVTVPPGDAQALADALVATLRDPGAPDRAAAAAASVPSFDDLARAYLGAFERALARAS